MSKSTSRRLALACIIVAVAVLALLLANQHYDYTGTSVALLIRDYHAIKVEPQYVPRHFIDGIIVPVITDKEVNTFSIVNHTYYVGVRDGVVVSAWDMTYEL